MAATGGRGRPANLAWVLMRGVNTDAEEAREIQRFFGAFRLRVILIDVNDPAGRLCPARGHRAQGIHLRPPILGAPVVRRYSGGAEKHAACGMLASRTRGGAAHEPPAAPPS